MLIVSWVSTVSWICTRQLQKETYVANAPSDCALLTSGGSLVCLTLDAWRVEDQSVLKVEGNGT